MLAWATQDPTTIERATEDSASLDSHNRLQELPLAIFVNLDGLTFPASTRFVPSDW